MTGASASDGASRRHGYGRGTALLSAAAEALDDGRDPLSTGFLAEHSVTLDECDALAGALALGARLVAWALDNPAEARAAINGAHLITAYRAISRSTR